LFCSGQIPLDPATGQLAGPDIRTQTARVLENIRAVLAAEKLDLVAVVKGDRVLTDLADFGAMNEVYGRYFTAEFPPARPFRWQRCRAARGSRSKWWRITEFGAWKERARGGAPGASRHGRGVRNPKARVGDRPVQ